MNKNTYDINNYPNLKAEGLVKKAIVFADCAHKGQYRKGSKTPYIVHPLEAGDIVATMTDDEEIIAAAILHDVLEDTPTTKEQLQETFGDRVTNLVCAESENKRRNQAAADTWKIRKMETIMHMKETSKEARMIALGDKLSNVRSLVRDYKTLGEDLWQRFNQKDKKEHAWYYQNMVEVLKDLESFDAWKELQRLVKEIF